MALLLGWILLRRNRRGARDRRAIALLVIDGLSLAEIATTRPYGQLADGWPAMALILVTAAVMLAGRSGTSWIDRVAVRLFVLMVAMPFAYAFGTTIGVYPGAGTAFHALAILTIVYAAHAGDRAVAVSVAAIGSYVLILAASVFDHPWRQPMGLAN